MLDLKSGQIVLDVGCGTGGSVFYMAKVGELLQEASISYEHRNLINSPNTISSDIPLQTNWDIISVQNVHLFAVSTGNCITM